MSRCSLPLRLQRTQPRGHPDVGIRGQHPWAVRMGCVASTRVAWAVFAGAIAREAWQPGSLSWSRNGPRSSVQLVSVHFLSPPPPLSSLPALSPGCPPSPNLPSSRPDPSHPVSRVAPEHPANRVTSLPAQGHSLASQEVFNQM